MEITDEVRKELNEKYGIYVCTLPAPKPINKGN